MDEQGNNVRRLATGATSRPSWSPDGKRIAYSSLSPEKIDGRLRLELFVVDADGSNPTMITSDIENSGDPCWSPDLVKIAFARLTSGVPGAINLFMLDTGSNNARRMTFARATDERPAWSPDGKKIAFQSNRDGNFEIYLLQVQNPQ